MMYASPFLLAFFVASLECGIVFVTESIALRNFSPLLYILIPFDLAPIAVVTSFIVNCSEKVSISTFFLLCNWQILPFAILSSCCVKLSRINRSESEAAIFLINVLRIDLYQYFYFAMVHGPLSIYLH